MGPRANGDATTFGDGSGGLTQGGSASPEPWRFDPGLDYETPFGGNRLDGGKPRSPQTLKQATSLAWVREQDFFYLRNNLLRDQYFHPQSSNRDPLVRRLRGHPEPALRVRVRPRGALRKHGFRAASRAYMRPENTEPN